MIINHNLIVEWAILRVTHLDKLQMYEDSYAVSQEFCEWTTLLSVYPEKIKTSVLQVPDFNKENRTD